MSEAHNRQISKTKQQTRAKQRDTRSWWKRMLDGLEHFNSYLSPVVSAERKESNLRPVASPELACPLQRILQLLLLCSLLRLESHLPQGHRLNVLFDEVSRDFEGEASIANTMQ